MDSFECFLISLLARDPISIFEGPMLTLSSMGKLVLSLNCCFLCADDEAGDRRGRIYHKTCNICPEQIKRLSIASYACVSAHIHTHTLAVHVMGNATCVSDGYQHVRCYLRKPSVKHFTVEQVERGREDDNNNNNNVIVEARHITTSHSLLPLLAEPLKQTQKGKMTSVGLCTLFPNARFCLNNLMFSM